MQPVIFIAFATATATPLVHDGGDASALISQAAPYCGNALDDVPIQQVFAQPPTATAGAIVRRCARDASSLSEARADLVRAEAALAAGKPVDVADHLDLAVARLGCLSEVADAPTASKIFLLRGAMAADQGRTEDAKAELRTALSFDGQVSWPTSYPVAGSRALAEVFHETERVTLTVAPRTTSGPWIDGKVPTDGPGSIRLGLHLAQHSARSGLSTAWLAVGGDATWVLPDALPTSALDTFAAGEHDAVATVLRTLYPQGACVAHQGGVWHVTAESVTEKAPPTPPAVEAPKKTRRGR